jgi:hypothetical protein
MRAAVLALSLAALSGAAHGQERVLHVGDLLGASSAEVAARLGLTAPAP